jgi:hypothetical protein
MPSFLNLPVLPDGVRIKQWYTRHYHAIIMKGQTEQLYGNWTIQSIGENTLVVVDEQDGMVVPWNEVSCLRFPMEESDILKLLNR